MNVAIPNRAYPFLKATEALLDIDLAHVAKLPIISRRVDRADEQRTLNTPCGRQLDWGATT